MMPARPCWFFLGTRWRMDDEDKQVVNAQRFSACTEVLAVLGSCDRPNDGTENEGDRDVGDDHQAASLERGFVGWGGRGRRSTTIMVRMVMPARTIQARACTCIRGAPVRVGTGGFLPPENRPVTLAPRCAGGPS